MYLIDKLVLKDSIPVAHSPIQSDAKYKEVSGIIWSDEDIITKNRELLIYKNWSMVHFSSPWYEIVSRTETNRNATTRDLTLLKHILGNKMKPAATIIDIHCGSGRHALALARQGYTIIGMEEIERPFTLARKQAEDSNINAKFVLSNDMQYAAYAGTADIVISMFNSLGYTFSQQDDQKQFNTIIRLLKPAGYFILDIRNHAYQKKQLKTPVTYKQLLSINDKQTATMYTTKFWQDNKLGAIEKIVDGPNILQHTTYGWNTYSLPVLTKMMQQAGAQIIKTHEDYYKDPRDTGERIIILAQKTD